MIHREATLAYLKGYTVNHIRRIMKSSRMKKLDPQMRSKTALFSLMAKRNREA